MRNNKSVWSPDATTARADYAIKRMIEAKDGYSRQGISTRGFDTCFEMGDADEVIAIIKRRSRKNRKVFDACMAYMPSIVMPVKVVVTNPELEQAILREYGSLIVSDPHPQILLMQVMAGELDACLVFDPV